MNNGLSRICVLALILALAPGAAEVAENLAHLVREGHLAHVQPAADHHEPVGPEHGCTPTSHLCPCHSSLTFLMVEAKLVSAPSPGGLCSEPPPARPQKGFTPAVKRPPRA